MGVNSDHRHWYRKFGRLQIGLTVYIHHYTNSPDRWVIRPEVIYDRKDEK